MINIYRVVNNKTPNTCIISLESPVIKSFPQKFRPMPRGKTTVRFCRNFACQEATSATQIIVILHDRNEHRENLNHF